MKFIPLATLLAVAALLVGCGPVEEYKIVGDYTLMAMDTDEQMSIWCGKWGRVDQTVFSVGFNERYVVAKQHPNGDRKLTNYFYIDRSSDSPSESEAKHVIGPLSEPEFRLRQQELSLPPFSRTIANLE